MEKRTSRTAEINKYGVAAALVLSGIAAYKGWRERRARKPEARLQGYSDLMASMDHFFNRYTARSGRDVDGDSGSLTVKSTYFDNLFQEQGIYTLKRELVNGSPFHLRYTVNKYTRHNNAGVDVNETWTTDSMTGRYTSSTKKLYPDSASTYEASEVLRGVEMDALQARRIANIIDTLQPDVDHLPTAALQ
jgi:hypothetical protein